MKVILAIVRPDFTDAVCDALIARQYHVTRVSTTGGFLRRGNTTLLCGVEDEQVEDALQIIRDACQFAHDEAYHPATIFVLNAAQHFRI
jgi:uncharacterized protein YaaQ